MAILWIGLFSPVFIFVHYFFKTICGILNSPSNNVDPEFLMVYKIRGGGKSRVGNVTGGK